MKIVQISDTHINQDPQSKLCGLAINTDETLAQVLKLVKLEKPDLILATGDLSQDGSIESYQRLERMLSSLKCDIYTIYGNHDNPENFNQYLVKNNIFQKPILETPIANFIFLNSHEAGTNSGSLNSLNLKHLKDSLLKYDNCIIVIHHHFVPLETFIDKYILKNSYELIEILTRYKHKIKFCLTGHVHNFYHKIIAGIPIYSSISTCMQFSKTKDLFIDAKNPGFMIYQFHENNWKVIEKIVT